jgi:ribulose-5-phosphate 4-epimerase/fuculose-1-phosphate aldolase
LQGHGIVSVATDVREATLGAAMLEQLAETALAAASTGTKPRVITQAEIGTLRGQVAGVEGRWAYYCDLAAAGEAR